MNQLIELYAGIVEALGLTSDTGGYIYAEEGKNKQLIQVKGLPLVLPTKDQIANMYMPNEKGVIEATKELYNPLRESAIKSQNESLNLTKNFMEIKLGFNFYAIGELLLHLVQASNLQKNTGPDVLGFLSKIGTAKSKNTKDLVDDATLDKWYKLYNKYSETNTYLTLYVNKNAKINATKYNRVAILDSKFYSDLLTLEGPEKILEGEKLRNKDVTIFKAIFELLIEGIENNDNTIKIGSNDTECPGFISIMSLYIRLANRFNLINEQVEFINKEKSINLNIDLNLTEEDLTNLSKYKTYLDEIPNNMVSINHQPQQPSLVQQQVNRSLPTHNPVQQQVVVNTPVVQQQVTQQPVQQQQVVPYNQALNQKPVSYSDPIDALKNKLKSDPMTAGITVISGHQQQVVSGPIVPQMVQQPMMPVMTQPIVQPQMQQVYMQPAMQQPMMTQQVAQPMVSQMYSQVQNQMPGIPQLPTNNPYVNMPTTNMYNNQFAPQFINPGYIR